MEYPYRKFLLYLLSKQSSEWEVQEQCRQLNLIPPNEASLKSLSKKLGDMPSFWQPNWTRSNTEFRRWLRDLGIEGLWKRSKEVIEAQRLCVSEAMRDDAQALILIHGTDFTTVREALLLKYPEEVVPGQRTLRSFYEVFWAVGEMSSRALLEFLQLREEEEQLQAAARGEKSTVYGMIGIPEKVKTETLLDNIIAFTNAKMEQARRKKHASQGELIGLAAVGRMGLEASQKREELAALGATETDDLVKAAKQFKLSRPKVERPIVSIDELQVIEEEEKNAAKSQHERPPAR